MDITKFPDVYRRIKTAVTREAPHLIARLEEKLTAYPGTVGDLNQFLLRYGRDNPWIVAQQLQLKRAVFRNQDEIDEEVLGTSISGHKLKRQLFVLAHPYDPTREVQSGIETLLSFMETFGTVEQVELLSPDAKKRRAAQPRKLVEQLGETLDDILSDPFEKLHDMFRKYFAPLANLKEQLKERLARPFKTIADVLADVLPLSYQRSDIVRTLDEVLHDPSRLRDVQSTLDRIKVYHILGLDEELKRRIIQLDRLAHTDTAYQDAEHQNYRALIALEPGGGVMSWLEKRIKQDENSVPREMRDMFSTLKNLDAPISDEERRFMYAAVLAYAAKERLVDRNAAVGGHLRDLKLLESLPDDHPIIEKYGPVNRAAIRDIEARNKITLIDATRVFDIYPIDAVRYEQNRSYLRQNEEAVDKLLMSLKPHFIQEGQWLPDAKGASVPMDRLKHTAYFLTLQREDFRAIQEMLKLQTSAGTKERLLKALPLDEFRERVDGLVIMARKFEYMEHELSECGVSLTTVDTLEAIAEKWQTWLKGQLRNEKPVKDARWQRLFWQWNQRLDDASDVFTTAFVEYWKVQLIRGNGYERDEHFKDAYGLTLDEALVRMDVLRRHETQWKKHADALKKEARFGLYSKKRAKAMETLFDQIKAYVPYDDALKARVENAQRTARHPLVFWSAPDFPSKESQYVHSRQIEVLQEYEQAAAEIVRGEQQARMQTLLEFREQVKGITFVSGCADIIVELAIRLYGGVEEPIKSFGRSIRILDMDRLEEHLTEWKKQYICVDELGEEWKNRAGYLASCEAESLLRSVQVGPSIERDYPAKRALNNPETFVDRKLAEQVNTLYERLKAVPPTEGIIVGDADELMQGELYEQYQVTAQGTMRADASRFRKYMPNLYWTGREWQGTITGGEVKMLTGKVQRYNRHYGTNIQVRMEKV